MARDKDLFFCTSCGNEFVKWSGQCSACKDWNTLKEQPKQSARVSTETRKGAKLETKASANTKPKERMKSGFGEVDRVLGDGILEGSMILFTGRPGIGKSTLTLQIVQNLAKSGKTALYVSGEESREQILSRSERLGGTPDNLHIANGYSIEDVLATSKELNADIIIVDSAQTFSRGDIASGAGSLPQIRAITETLMHLAKSEGKTVFLIGQVTKDGEMAGPQLLAHMVDVVVHFDGDGAHDTRILRTNKNRFGSSDEVGLFTMGEKGLVEITNPSEAFLSGRLQNAVGSSVFAAMEGNRPFLIEMQALTATSPYGMPKRSASGFPIQRLSLLLAVLEKHGNIKTASLDVFANVVGGIQIAEPAADLALAMAIASSQKKIALAPDLLVLGELGLSGEVRAVGNLPRRIKEAEAMGFGQIIVPKGKLPEKTKARLIPVATLGEALREAIKK